MTERRWNRDERVRLLLAGSAENAGDHSGIDDGGFCNSLELLRDICRRGR